MEDHATMLSKRKWVWKQSRIKKRLMRCQMFNLFLSDVWACLVWIYMNTNTQHGCCSPNLLLLKEQTSAPRHHHWSGPAPQKTGRTPRFGQKATGEWEEQVGGGREGNQTCTSTLTFRLWTVSRRALLLLVQEALGAQRRFRVQVLLVWTGLLHVRQPHSEVVSEKTGPHIKALIKKKHDKSIKDKILTFPVWWIWCVPPGCSRRPSPAARFRGPRWDQNSPSRASAQDIKHW